MAVQSAIKIEGLDEMQKIFDGMILREAQNLQRATVHAVASQIAKHAKKSAPTDTGNLRRAIKAIRRRPKDPNRPYSDVVVAQGKKTADAYYWRFIEYGTQKQAARPFFSPAINEMRAQFAQIYREQFYKKLAQKIKRDRKKRLK